VSNMDHLLAQVITTAPVVDEPATDGCHSGRLKGFTRGYPDLSRRLLRTTGANRSARVRKGFHRGSE